MCTICDNLGQLTNLAAATSLAETATNIGKEHATVVANAIFSKELDDLYQPGKDLHESHQILKLIQYFM